LLIDPLLQWSQGTDEMPGSERETPRIVDFHAHLHALVADDLFFPWRQVSHPARFRQLNNPLAYIHHSNDPSCLSAKALSLWDERFSSPRRVDLPSLG
jgi:hypothetical protein